MDKNIVKTTAVRGLYLWHLNDRYIVTTVKYDIQEAIAEAKNLRPDAALYAHIKCAEEREQCMRNWTPPVIDTVTPIGQIDC